MKNSVKKVLNVICMIFFMWLFVCSLLFGCSNIVDEELVFNNDTQEQLETILNVLDESGEYETSYDLTSNNNMIQITIRSTNENIIFDNMKINYNKIEIDTKLETLKNNLNNSIISTLRNSDYEGTILISFTDYNNKDMFTFTCQMDNDTINMINNKLETSIEKDQEEAEQAEKERQEQIQRQQEEEQRRQEEIRKQQENTLPQAVIDYLDSQIIVESEGELNYEMVNGSIVIYTDWVSKTVAKALIFNGNDQYMNTYLSKTLPEALEVDALNIRLLGCNKEIILEIRTSGNVSYRIVVPENNYEASVTINKF